MNNSRRKTHRHEVENPTYHRDITGEIKRWDERDIVFARSDLYRTYGEESDDFAAYYKLHPEWREIDSTTNSMPGLGRTGGGDSPMFEAQFAAITQLGKPSTTNANASRPNLTDNVERATFKIKEFTRILGADLVNIGPLRQEWVYTHNGRVGSGRRGEPIDLRHHKTAIVIGIRMDYDLIQHAPDFPVLLATAKGYANGAWVAAQLTNYLNFMGYSAHAHYDANYLLQCVPVAVDSGMGELSRAGFLITKEFGLALRLAVVTTNMDLDHDKPVDIGVQSFCDTCKICAEACPIGAIPDGDKVVVNGTRRWKLDAEKCYRYWHTVGTDCGLCMASCPWSKQPTWFHRRMADLASIKGPHQAWMVAAEKAVYGKFKSKRRPDFIDDDPRWHHLLVK